MKVRTSAAECERRRPARAHALGNGNQQFAVIARREPGAQFLLAWLIPSWIVFEAVLTKLPHYVLPLYPAIAILTAGAVERRVLSRSWLMRGSAWWFGIPDRPAVPKPHLPTSPV